MAIDSESRIVWKLIIETILLPFNFILCLFGKRKLSDLLKPIKDLFSFIVQAKVTFILILSLIIVFLLEIFIIKNVDSLVFLPSDIFSLNIVPIIASWFLHASLAHLTGNILFLFVFGRVVEKNFGGTKLIIIYFGSAIISSLLSGFLGEGGIGASGAIAGLISAAILIQPFYLSYLFFGIPIPIFIVGWLAMMSDITAILYSQKDNIAHFAHLGGYIAIAFIVFFLSFADRKKLKIGLVINLAIASIAFFAYAYFQKLLILAL